MSRAAETATASDRRVVLKELLILALAALIPMRILKEVVDAGAWEILLVGVPLLFIYAPVLRCKYRGYFRHREANAATFRLHMPTFREVDTLFLFCRSIWTNVLLLYRYRGVDADTYRLHIPAFRDGRTWWRAIRINLILFAIITVPWLVGYHCYYTYGSQFLPLPTPVPGSGLPDGLLTIVLFQLFFVAVPEEFFYRGYFQTRLNEVYPRKWLIFGVPMGWGSVVACLFFAFGHTVVLFQWWHFATFFPGMVFAWLREKTDGVIAGAFFHAGCNIGIVTLDTWYGII